ncbi:unnamed protein product [Eruca vesicaria subsp. sativa]|uniref:non-specific serine/threonine protein kinase n=1 Tax=Eruca vesicaria subsp. sativa TaxID=29727 RepID=A0ABC8LGL7_ERUVS|nr:unnamed protein product [Eruca vesicaria subsp. sativa]
MDIKSSNILLDKQWNAEVSDFGLAKLLGSKMSYVTTRVMGTFGYVAPEYAKNGNQEAEGVLDPRLVEKPSLMSLKRSLLVALRCIDPNAQKRPKMGHVIHMLEAEDSVYKDDRRNSGGGGDPRKMNVTEAVDESVNSILIKNDQLALEKEESW